MWAMTNALIGITHAIRWKAGSTRLPFPLQLDRSTCVLVDVACGNRLTIVSDDDVELIQVCLLLELVRTLTHRVSDVATIGKLYADEASVLTVNGLCLHGVWVTLAEKIQKLLHVARFKGDVAKSPPKGKGI